MDVLEKNKNHKAFNISKHVIDRLDKRLFLKDGHPVHTIKQILEKYFAEKYAHTEHGAHIKAHDGLSPVVTIQANFDDLLFPKDHPGRAATDTYYINDEVMLRAHTSAHQTELMRKGEKNFLLTADVYRRDSVDPTHYPIFHQTEGVRIFTPEEMARFGGGDEVEFIFNDMKKALEGMARELFGDVKMRWVDEYFPFTDPSTELEIFYNGDWLEVLGCGVIHKDILKNCNMSDHKGWAFGMGLERLAMVLFSIPDIRLFWSEDERFTRQFKSGEIVKFKPYSKYPACYKDMTFWLPDRPPENPFHENEFYEHVRECGGDNIEDIVLLDKWTNPKTKRTSHCYRINYRSMDRNLTNAEVDVAQNELRESMVKKFGVELR